MKGKISKIPTKPLKKYLPRVTLVCQIQYPVKSKYMLFENNKLITQGAFEQKFNCQTNYLSYANLTKVIRKQILTEDRKKDMNDGETPPHFNSNFHEIFGTNTKGSQTYRKILKYDEPENP